MVPEPPENYTLLYVFRTYLCKAIMTSSMFCFGGGEEERHWYLSNLKQYGYLME